MYKRQVFDQFNSAIIGVDSVQARSLFGSPVDLAIFTECDTKQCQSGSVNRDVDIGSQSGIKANPVSRSIVFSPVPVPKPLSPFQVCFTESMSDLTLLLDDRCSNHWRQPDSQGTRKEDARAKVAMNAIREIRFGFNFICDGVMRIYLPKCFSTRFLSVRYCVDA